jgi:hypothetical protein
MKTLSEIRNFLITSGYSNVDADIFLAYHRKNKNLWILYQRKALELINKGASRLSSKSIFEKLREDADFKTISEDFKLTNNYTAYYARCFIYFYPQYKDLFELRPVGERLAA